MTRLIVLDAVNAPDGPLMSSDLAIVAGELRLLVGLPGESGGRSEVCLERKVLLGRRGFSPTRFFHKFLDSVHSLLTIFSGNSGLIFPSVFSQVYI